jgi:hypothetical protein
MIDDRRARVARCKVQGLSIRQSIAALAKDGCVNPDTKKPWAVSAIQADLVHLTGIWQASAIEDITLARGLELAKLDQLEREAWAAWYRSIGRAQTRTTKTGRIDKDGTVIAEPEVTLRTEVLVGDPRFMAVILDCQARRAKLLGLDAPAKLHVDGQLRLEDLVAGSMPEEDR